MTKASPSSRRRRDARKKGGSQSDDGSRDENEEQEEQEQGKMEEQRDQSLLGENYGRFEADSMKMEQVEEDEDDARDSSFDPNEMEDGEENKNGSGRKKQWSAAKQEESVFVFAVNGGEGGEGGEEDSNEIIDLRQGATLSAPPPEMHDEDACDVCKVGTWTDRNKIVFCEGECGVAVHQQCYGIGKLPEGAWICDLCISNTEEREKGESASADADLLEDDEDWEKKRRKTKRKKPISCAVCRDTGGAFKPFLRTSSHVSQKPESLETKWVHPACVLTVPEMHFKSKGDVLVGLGSHALRQRRGLPCAFCNRTAGVCLSCSARGCEMSYHVRCGQNFGLTFTYLDGIADKPTFCAEHEHLIGKKGAEVESNLRRGLGISGPAPELTQEEIENTSFEAIPLEQDIPAQVSYNTSDLWRDVEPRLDFIAESEAFNWLVKPKKKKSITSKKLKRSATEMDGEVMEEDLLQEMMDEETDDPCRRARENLETILGRSVLTQEQNAGNLMSEGSPNKKPRLDPKAPSSAEMSISLEVSMNNDGDVVFNERTGGDSDEEDNELAVRIRYVVGSDAQENSNVGTLCKVSRAVPKGLAEFRSSLANAAEDSEFLKDALAMCRVETVALVDELRARVRNAQRHHKGVFVVPNLGNPKQEAKYARLLGRCQSCDLFECEHKRAAREKLLKRGITKPLQVVKVKNERIRKDNKMSYTAMNLARLEWMSRLEFRSSWLDSEIENVSDLARPRVVNSSPTTAELAVEYLKMRVVYKIKQEAEQVQKEAEREERRKKELAKRGKRKGVRGIASFNVDPADLPDPPKSLILQVRRAAEKKFEFVKAEPEPFDKRRVRLKVNGMNLSLKR